MQVAFLLEEQTEAAATTQSTDNKLVLGQLNIQWRSAIGDRGLLSTGWLTGRKR
jgi:trafficking protein particle complex subunit 13